MKIVPISVELLGSYGGDLEVVNAARVSMDKQSQYVKAPGEFCGPLLTAEDAKLINYLAKHEHTSPFNHAFLSFRVKAPIFVARQLVKHKFLPWNEVSRRYVSSEPEFYLPDVWRAKADNVKQGSLDVGVEDGSINDQVFAHLDNSLYMYEQLLAAGVAPEQARMVLPQNTMTEWVWSGTLGAFLDMLKLRLNQHAQKESRDVAEQVAEHVQTLFPCSFKARIG